MSTLKADTLQAKTTNGTLTLANNGTGKVELPADATIGGVAMTTAFASGATAAEKSNIMLNSFRIEEQGGLTVQGMVDGVSDVFTDESGVDTATSTDEVYNAAGDYYQNQATVEDGTWAAGGAVASSWGQGVPSRAFIGIQFTASQTGTITQSMISPHAVNTAFLSHCELWSDSSGSPGSQIGTDSSQVNLATTGDYTLTFSTPPSVTASTLYWLVFVDDTNTTGDVNAEVLLPVTGFGSGQSDTLTSITDSGTAGYGAGSDYRVSITNTGAAANSVIVSETFTALSQPDTAFTTIWHEDVDACTPNTDFTVEVSRDGGTTWTAGTLALATTLGAAEILTCSIDISAQPAGTSIRWRFKFLNTKSQRLRGVALQWS